MDKHTFRDKVLGAVVGYAIGDALGIGTEFMSRRSVERTYPGGLKRFDQIIEDAHRSMWGRGNWSHGTNFILLLIDHIMTDGGIMPMNIANTMSERFALGLYDVPVQIRQVLGNESYRSDPVGTVKKLWEKFGSLSDSNSVLGVSGIVGMYADDVEKGSETLCSILQHGPKSRGSSHIVAQAAHDLLYGNHTLTHSEATEIAQKYTHDLMIFIDRANREGGIDDASIDDEDTSWWVRKGLCATMWGLWTSDSFEQGLINVVNLGGDAGTNAAITALLLGLKYGYSAIPQHLVDSLVKKDFILEKAEAFADFLTINRL